MNRAINKMNLQKFYQKNSVTDLIADMIEMIMPAVLFSTYFPDFSAQ